MYELLPHLNHLDLGDNELTFITSSEFSPLVNLRSLKLDGNRITTISSSVFTRQFELKTLNLARNGITRISHGAFHNLHNLTELDLSHNKLENPENGLFEPVAESLEVLILSGNRLSIAVLKSLLKNLNVRELRLKSCGLGDIPFRMFPESVKSLDLAQNHISAMAADAVPSNLQQLDISQNRFKGLDQDLLIQLDNVKNLTLDHNPWSCDLCHIVPLLERIHKRVAIRNIECHQPYSAKGKKLSVIKQSELTWCTVSKTSDANYFLLGDDGQIGLIAAGSSVCLLFLTVVGILSVLCYTRRHAAKYYTHEDKLAMEGDSIFDNHSPLFCDERELSFKFPLDSNEKKLSVSTIDEIKKEHAITNGT